MLPVTVGIRDSVVHLVSTLVASSAQQEGLVRVIVSALPVELINACADVSAGMRLFPQYIFRGFLLPSLCKHLPVPVSIVVSAVVFAFAHFSVEFWRLVTLGVFLGVTFVLTRNLAAPVLMHGLWNAYVYYHIVLS